MYEIRPSARGIANRTTAVTAKVDRIRLKISGSIVVFSGTISWTLITTRAVRAATPKVSAAPM
jgi:hypothetical protein